MAEIRVPIQKRSIEKRERIIKKGFELMCENGYFNTTTDDIAKYANVSTGIIYQYFNDKKDIFMEGIKSYSANIMYPMINILEKDKIEIKNFKQLINSMIDKFIDSHNMSKKAHEELLAMSYLDQDISTIFKNNELLMTDKIAALLKSNGFKIPNLEEKVHIIIGIVDNFCHEVVYHKHENIDYKAMKEEVINIIISTLR